ncbi:MAG: polysaccharide deacetylase family protein [Actinobacteria bacterium]|nr:polysaccharide deacetylase family protein [Actinomycetota bacterium]
MTAVDTRRLVKRLSRAADAALPRHTGVTVLIYHRVGGGSDSQVDLPVDEFDRQMAHLAEHATVVTLDDAVASLAARRDEGPCVVITFDDGTDDFTDHAVPVLVKHSLPATLYAATSFIDSGTTFPWDAPPTSWTALRDATATGLVTIGSHTHSHWLLDRLDPAAIADDLDRSIDLIGTHLGAAPAHFAYPKALPGSPQAEIAVRRRFTSAALAASRVNRPGHTDLHRLWRTPVQRADGFEFFTAKAQGGLRLEGELRALAARFKYRGAAT